MRHQSWRSVARDAAYSYPGLHAQLMDIQAQSVTPSLTGMPRAGGEHRSTEDAALRQLPKDQQIKHDAVAHAIAVSVQLTSGLSRQKLISLVYFRRPDCRLNLQGAAMQIPCSPHTAKIWNSDFLLLVWAYLRGDKVEIV